MSNEKSKEEEIFLAAIDLPTDERRRGFVDDACRGDEALRERVLGLLGADAESQLRTPKTRSAAEPSETHVGPFRLLEAVGEGGMGTVYRAEQREPVRRLVALKVIKRGMDTKAVIARFEAERQALALMDHPFVAKVFDAGATVEGRPYFVMEYVSGEPITKYCDRQRLDMAARLRLFQGVCDAVQHAHQKGIIHRDLKPSNILVEVREDRSFPKIIDFGVAKSTQQRLSDRTVFTELGQIIGTPEYMSPEQVEMSGTDVDTRTDVYALGVILYELLVGVLPFDATTLRAAGYPEIQRIIREVEPPKPSTRMRALGADSTVSATARHSDPQTLRRKLRQDLDWVVMKCLEKDRTRRYSSASELSADIERYLAHEPVLAGPPSASYRLKKFLRRNRALATAIGIVCVGLSGGIAAATYGLIEESKRSAELTKRTEELTKSKEELTISSEALTKRTEELTKSSEELTGRTKELQLVVDFQARQLAGINVEKMGERLHARLRENVRAALKRAQQGDAEVEQNLATLDALLKDSDFTGLALSALDESIFARAFATIDKQFKDQPLVQAHLLYSLATTARWLGLLDRALEPQSRALEIRRRLLGNHHDDTVISINEMATLLQSLGKYQEAESHYREALELGRRIYGEEDFRCIAAISNYGDFLKGQGKISDAEPYYREAFELGRRFLSEDDPNAILLFSNMGSLLRSQGKLAEAEPYYRGALDAQRRLLSETDPRTLSTLHRMGMLLREQGKLDEAEKYYREALTHRRRILGDPHPHTQNTVNDLGLLLMEQGKLKEAEPYCREVVEVSRASLGAEHDDTLTSVNNLGLLLRKMEKFAEAEVCFREAYEGTRRLLGDEHSKTLSSMGNLGVVLRELGRLEEADEFGAKSVQLGRKTSRPGHWSLGVSLLHHGQTLIDMKRFAEGAAELEEAYTILFAALGDIHYHTSDALTQLVACYKAWHAADPGAGHEQKAAAWQAKLQAIADRKPTAPE
ncbi:MAG: tetratricopeptide repeat protein [Planctomycetota bacterium]